MVCLYCGSTTSVINSRAQVRQNNIWRRRECDSCKGVVTTHETIDLSKSILVRAQNRRKLQPFSRDTLFVSILESCKHRPRATQEASALTETIIATLLRDIVGGTVERNNIVQIAHKTLRHFDPIAATLYAAYHKSTPA